MKASVFGRDNPSQTSLIFVIKAGKPGLHLYLRVCSNLSHKEQTCLKKFTKGKHSSLLFAFPVTKKKKDLYHQHQLHHLQLLLGPNAIKLF